MATATCAAAAISLTHGHGLPTKPHTDSPLLSFTNLPIFNTKHSALTTFKSFHVKLGSPVTTSITAVDDAELVDAKERTPRAISSRARRSQGITSLATHSPRRRVKSPSPPTDDHSSSPASKSPVIKAMTPSSARPKPASKPVAKPVLTATIPAVPIVSKPIAPMPTAPSFTITPSETVHRYIQDEWGPYELGQVCGPPTRGHWRVSDLM